MFTKKTKRYLMLLAALGLIAIAAGSSGTFATFNAETANTNNTFATGSIFLHTTKQGSSNICKSESDTSNNQNVLSTNGCDTLITIPNLSAGASGTVNLTLENAGSINASKLKIATGTLGCQNGRPNITTTNQAVSSGAQTTINVAALPYALVKGTQITISDTSNSDTLTLASNAAASATQIDVTGSSTTHSYSTGANVKFAVSFGAANLCSNIQFYIAETDTLGGTQKECLFPAGAGACTFGSTHISDLNPYSYPTFDDVTSALWSGATSGTDGLDAGKARYIQIGWQAPAAASFNNPLQNATATFDLVWHIEQ